MPSVHIRKELYEELESHGTDTTETVNEILKNYIMARNVTQTAYSSEDLHIREYHEHGNAD